MILTVTPNPALDISCTVAQLVADEKNYVSDEIRSPGGNAINVARLLKRIGIPVKASGFLGQSVGDEIGNLLDIEKVHRDFIQIKGRTRIGISVSNLKTHKQTRLGFSGPRVTDHEISLLIKNIKGNRDLEMLVLGGSFPPGFRISHANRILEAAHSRSISVVVDIPGPLMRGISLDGLLLIKPNLTEFQQLVGSKVKSASAVARLAKKLAHKIGLVCVSSVEGGAVLASRDFVWFGAIPKKKIKSTVGAGDSMVAGICAEIWRRKISCESCNDDSLLPELLRQGLAASAATLVTSGTELGGAKSIKKFSKEIIIRKLRI